MKITRDTIKDIEEKRLNDFNSQFLAFVKGAKPVKSFEELDKVRDKIVEIANEAFDILQLVEQLKKITLDD